MNTHSQALVAFKTKFQLITLLTIGIFFTLAIAGCEPVTSCACMAEAVELGAETAPLVEMGEIGEVAALETEAASLAEAIPLASEAEASVNVPLATEAAIVLAPLETAEGPEPPTDAETADGTDHSLLDSAIDSGARKLGELAVRHAVKGLMSSDREKNRPYSASAPQNKQGSVTQSQIDSEKDRIHVVFGQTRPQASVIAVRGKTVRINIGSNQNVNPGLKLAAYRHDPDSLSLQYFADLRVVAVGNDQADATIEFQQFPIKIGDQVADLSRSIGR